MKTELTEVTYNGSRLLAVPSVHFNHVFATEVNRLCSLRTKPPDAIAVELGPQAAIAVRAWLKELGVAPGTRKELPVMLGLTQKNRLIRASLKERALRLQQDTGKDLSELPPDVLYDELGFAGNSLTCLTPTDSIIEAIRCSLELGVPLYGVDLEETANCDYERTSLEDPNGRGTDIEDFIMRNAPYAAGRRDTEVDRRREIAMAARLKAILANHHRVVFVCGLAHWLSIREMLHDSSILPSFQSLTPPEQTNGMFRRVVLHPVKAVQHMDLFPAVVREYEKHRKPPCRMDDRRTNRLRLDPQKIFRSLLKRAYTDYFVKRQDQGRYRQQDLEALGGFEGYLNNLCLTNHRTVPDISMTIGAAQEMMSNDFVRVLTRACMAYPWTSPEDHPGCALLAPGLDDDMASETIMLKDGDIPWKERHSYVRTVPGQGREDSRVRIPYEWDYEKAGARKVWGDDFLLHTWIPWEYLISSLSLRAIDYVRKKGRVRRVQPFEGSLMDGIDIKATLKSHSRGRETVYVRTTIEEHREHVSQPIGNFPVVWLLDVKAPGDREWIPLYESCDWMKRHVRNRRELEHVRESRGDKMIALIAYGSRHEGSRATRKDSRIRSDRCDGIVIYQPICWTRKQFARWVELTDYRRNPFCRHGSLGPESGDLTRLFDKEHGVKIGEHHWTTALILMALPYAKEMMAVVAPDDYVFDPLIRETARRCGVEVCRVPLTSFSLRERKRLAINHMAPARLNDPRAVFDKSIEAAVGDKQTDNEDLVPRDCMEFGMT